MNKAKKPYMFFGIVVIGLLLVSIMQATVSSGSGIPWRVKKGDLLFMDCDGDQPFIYHLIGRSNDHVAIYAGNGEFWQTGETVEKVSWSHFEENFKNFEYYRVKGASTSQINGAIDFCERREDDSYQIEWLFSPHKNHNPFDPFDFCSNKWYCSELVWAAYYNQGIDIDKEGYAKDHTIWYHCPAVEMGSPYSYIRNDIKYDSDTKKIA